jgi:hypothetical protein
VDPSGQRCHWKPPPKRACCVVHVDKQPWVLCHQKLWLAPVEATTLVFASPETMHSVLEPCPVTLTSNSSTSKVSEAGLMGSGLIIAPFLLDRHALDGHFWCGHCFQDSFDLVVPANEHRRSSGENAKADNLLEESANQADALGCQATRTHHLVLSFSCFSLIPRSVFIHLASIFLPFVPARLISCSTAANCDV